jgi:hypothetical protein
MGNLATPESRIARWQEVLADPTLQDLPYKIELNVWGKVEMSPASNRHGRLQAVEGSELPNSGVDGQALELRGERRGNREDRADQRD